MRILRVKNCQKKLNSFEKSIKINKAVFTFGVYTTSITRHGKRIIHNLRNARLSTRVHSNRKEEEREVV